MQTVLARERKPRPEATGGRRGLFTNPQGLPAYLVLRPLSDLFLWAWRLERRLEFLYRPWFDKRLRPPLFSAAQALQNARRANPQLRLPAGLRRGLFAQPATYPAWVRFSGPGPYAPPDIEDLGQCSVGIKVMGVPGAKLMDDEQFTQDLILVSPASFVTPNVIENAKLQRWVRAKAPLAYAINPGDSHLLHLFMQMLYSPMHANPLEVQYYSNVPFLLGEGQAVQYSLKPAEPAGTKIPVRPAENYLRDAMISALAAGPWTFDFMVQVQTDPYLMPIEDATVKWPERLSPYVPVARLRLPAQRFDSDRQLAFADVLRYNPWHSLAEHKPLGNSNRARRTMYYELAKLRQAMNDVQHVEPTGEEQFPDC